MAVQTNSQRMAQAAYQQIVKRAPSKEFGSFAREFPSLVHSCGLAQAIAFARSKKDHHTQYLDDLAAVLTAMGHSEVESGEGLEKVTRENPVRAYVRLSRNALQVAGWLKRYVETAEQE